jgi:NAD kinase
MYRPAIAIITATTRMQGLLMRWGTKGAARFRLNQAVMHVANSATIKSASSGMQASSGKTAANEVDQMSDATFNEYELEDVAYQASVERSRREIDLGYPITIVQRQHIPNFDFSNVIVVVVVGQDGLVANVAKYARGLPIIGINPDPSRIDGILVPFHTDQLRMVLQKVLKGSASVRDVTLARASMNDGQTMLAFNEIFVGRRSHASARYTLRVGTETESQSSSGVIVATGAGSTGWLSSVFNMAHGVNRWIGGRTEQAPSMQWDERRLVWVVREPFQSKHSSIHHIAGSIHASETLTLSSLMPDTGVVFSDGIESDFMEFNSGSILRVEVAKEVARLVVS